MVSGQHNQGQKQDFTNFQEKRQDLKVEWKSQVY